MPIPIDHLPDDATERRLDALTAKLEQTTAALSKVSQDLTKGHFDQAVEKVLRAQQRQFEKQINALVKDALTAAVGKTAGQGSFLSSLTGFIPGFARGGILNRKTLLAHGAEAGPEVVLPLKKGADGRLGVVAQQQSPRMQNQAYRQAQKIEVHIAGAGGASLSIDDQEAIASAVMQAMDHAIDERLSVHLQDGGLMTRPSHAFSSSSMSSRGI